MGIIKKIEQHLEERSQEKKASQLRFLCSCGQIGLSQNITPMALENYSKALEIDSEYIPALAGYGRALFKMRKHLEIFFHPVCDRWRNILVV